MPPFDISPDHRRNLQTTGEEAYADGRRLIGEGIGDLRRAQQIRQQAQGAVTAGGVAPREIAQAADRARLFDIAEGLEVLLGHRAGSESLQLPRHMQDALTKAGSRTERLVTELTAQRNSISHPEAPQRLPLSAESFLEQRQSLIDTLKQAQRILPKDQPSERLVSELLDRVDRFEEADPTALKQGDYRQAARYHDLRGARGIAGGAERTEGGRLQLGRAPVGTTRLSDTALGGSDLEWMYRDSNQLAHPVASDGRMTDFDRMPGMASPQMGHYLNEAQAYEASLEAARPKPVDPRLAELERRRLALMKAQQEAVTGGRRVGGKLGLAGPLVGGSIAGAAVLLNGQSAAEAAQAAGEAAVLASPVGPIEMAQQGNLTEARLAALEATGIGFAVTEIYRPLANGIGLMTGQGKVVEDSLLTQALQSGINLVNSGVGYLVGGGDAAPAAPLKNAAMSADPAVRPSPPVR